MGMNGEKLVVVR